MHTAGPFENLDLSHQDFSGAMLDGENFSHCQLWGTNFRSASLVDAQFQHCRFYNPNTQDNDESHTQFDFAKLKDALFSHCDLTMVSFKHIGGYGLRLDQCQAQGADFSKANFLLPIGDQSDLAEFSMVGCNFAYGDLSNTYLCGCELRDNRMIEVLLNNTNLADADLRDCNLSNAHISGSVLTGVDLRGAEFNNLDPRKIDLSGAKIDPDQLATLATLMDLIIAERD